jgi:hypothetical protein
LPALTVPRASPEEMLSYDMKTTSLAEELIEINL